MYHLACTTAVKLFPEAQENVMVISHKPQAEAFCQPLLLSLFGFHCLFSFRVMPCGRSHLHFFQAVLTPGTVKLVATSLGLAKTIRISLSTLNASDQSCCVQEILSWQKWFFAFLLKWLAQQNKPSCDSRSNGKLPGKGLLFLFSLGATVCSRKTN